MNTTTANDLRTLSLSARAMFAGSVRLRPRDIASARAAAWDMVARRYLDASKGASRRGDALSARRFARAYGAAERRAQVFERQLEAFDARSWN